MSIGRFAGPREEPTGGRMEEFPSVKVVLPSAPNVFGVRGNMEIYVNGVRLLTRSQQIVYDRDTGMSITVTLPITELALAEVKS